MLDVFKSDLFSFTSLTDAINSLPNKPGELGEWFTWNAKGVATTSVITEEKDGTLSLIQSQPRGAAPNIGTRRPARRGRSVEIFHYPAYETVLATEVQGVRQFGSEDQMETVVGKIAEKNQLMLDNHEINWEWQRVGAVNGLLLDADGSVLENWFTFFNKTKTTHIIDLTDPTIDVRMKLIEAKAKGERELGALRPKKWKLVCGSDYHNDLVSHKSVKEAYDRFQDGSVLRDDLRNGFMIATDIEVVSYHRGYLVTETGDLHFIAPDEAKLIPDVDGLFQVRFAPADTLEAANTIGLPLYNMSEPMPFDRGATLCSESNSLHYCTRITAIVHITQD
jgi:hypothetical protein